MLQHRGDGRLALRDERALRLDLRAHLFFCGGIVVFGGIERGVCRDWDWGLGVLERVELVIRG